MRHRLFVATLLAAATLSTIFPTITNAQTAPATPTTLSSSPPAGPLKPETPEHAARIAWWREARFGMFIHWGLYAVPAGTYKDQKIAGLGEWIMNRGKIPVKDYENFAKEFNPTKFNADEWAQLAQDAGMKYLAITSKHHDGFAMYGSKVTPYNVVDATPWHHDPMKDLAEACAKRNIKFGFYYSQAQDWHEPGGMGNDWDFPSEDEKDKSGAYDKYLQEKAEPQVKEILSNYGPIALIWFDTPHHMTKERAERFEKIVHDLQPNCLVSGRIGPGSVQDYDSEGDNHIPGVVRGGDWETPATLNDTWGFKSYDNNWKNPEDITFKLVDIASKGGNYLLNVGPTSEGLIPQPEQDILHTVGKWMAVNGEAIYGTGPTPFGAELGKPTDKKDNRNRVIYDIYKDWRCTTKPGKLYFSIFNWPKDGKFTTPILTGKVKSAYLLADTEKKPLTTTTSDKNELTITIPTESPTPIAGVIVVETE